MSSRIKAIKSRASSIKRLDKQISDLQDRIKEKRAAKDKLEREAIDMMKKEKLESVKGPNYIVSISELDVPTLKDFISLWKWARKNNHPEIFQRRVSSKAWREHDQDVPGVGTYTKTQLSIRSRK